MLVKPIGKVIPAIQVFQDSFKNLTGGEVIRIEI
jgi:hypothetical protein